jgi:two-component system sensor histidine kinase AgrC
MRFDLLAVNVIATMFFGLNVIFLSKIIYQVKFNLKSTIAFSLFFGLVNGLVSYFINFFNINYFILKSMITVFVSIVLVKAILNFNFRKSFILIGLYFVIVLVSESISFLIYSLFNVVNQDGIIETFRGDLFNLIFGNILVFIIFFAILLLINLFKAYFRFPKNTRTIIFTLGITILTTSGNIWFILYNINTHTNTNIVLFTILSILTIIYFAYIIFNVNISYKFERQSLELEQQKFYNESISKTLDNLKRLKHGYNNNLNVLYSFAKSGDHEKLLDYFNEVIQINNQVNDTNIFNIKNAALYGIISSKVQYAEELGVEFKIIADSEIMEIKNIRMPELCELMGIFLDNAIEAASEGKNKIVRINITQDEECIEIIIKNSYEETPDLGNIFMKGFSTKGDGRGMGLWIVKDILKNNKYVINNTYLSKGMFCQELIIRK